MKALALYIITFTKIDSEAKISTSL